VPPLAAKTTPIKAKVTGTLGIRGVIKGLIAREEEGVKIEVKVAEVEAIGAKISHVRTKSRRTILRTSYQLISVPFAGRRAIIKLIVLCIRGYRPNISRSRRIRAILRLKGILLLLPAYYQIKSRMQVSYTSLF
jgi:hypothetical protein